MVIATQTTVRPLEAGDRLDRAEFHRRYLATPSLKKAELVEGIVYVPSPLHVLYHATPHLAAGHWLSSYAVATPGVHAGDNGTVILDAANEVQPDLFARLDAVHGGRSHITADGFIAGPPELVIEIASSSASYDLHAKRALYERVGVQEYLVWRTRDSAIDWWALEGGRYATLPQGADGRIASRVLPGLVLDVPALLAGDLARVLAAQQAQHGSPAHTVFVARLGRAQGAR